ncbi:MAG: class I SAM-dependent methyltransferase [Hyphomicrobiaceae bacterium]|nr:class I SAM-dependent methyltransferase [Hyphomicrobiaceae bacterium]
MLARPTSLNLITTTGFAGYALIDSGQGRKLERFGDVLVDRPERQALWRKALPAQAWAEAHAVFSASEEDEDKGRWRVDRPVPESWPVRVGNATMLCRLQGLWHLGLFPEQYPHWMWMLDHIAAVRHAGVERPRVLNLFAYTGAASLLAAAAGAEVTHVDASKKAVAWARENQAASRLADTSIRWLIEDAAKFTAREVRRGKRYHIVLVDPPKFGRGPSNETWDLFDDLPPLLSDCAQLVAEGPAAIVLTVYAIRASALSFGQLAAEALVSQGGSLETGELAIVPVAGGSAVPTSLFARWHRGEAP